MNNCISLYGTVISLPKQASVDKNGKIHYSFYLSADRPSGFADVIRVVVKEDTEAFRQLIAIDQLGDLFERKLLIRGEVHTRSYRISGKNKVEISVRAVEILDQEWDRERNVAIIKGHVCKIKPVRETPRGIKIIDIILACQRERGSVSDYIPVIAWNGMAVRMAERLKVGDAIEVRGRLQSRVYEKMFEDGTREDRVCYELSVESYSERPDENRKMK